MDKTKEYIKALNCKLLSSEKITFSKIDNYHKLYHNGYFICYIPITNEQIPYDNINKYILQLKQKVNTYIICITNNDNKLINIILNQYIKLDKYNILIISPNNNYLQFAIDNNINYIISMKNDYMTMSTTCLNIIKSSPIANDIIFITNTETLVHYSLIPEIISSHKKDSKMSLPSSLKYIDLTNGSVSNIFISKNTLTPNWIIINKNFNEVNLLKNVNIQYINVSGTLCTNFLDKNHVKLNNTFLPNELKTLSLLTEYSDKFNKYFIIPTQEPIIIDITPPQKPVLYEPNSNFKTYILQRDSILSYNSIVNKFYFINVSIIHQTIINSTFKKSIQQIITKPQIAAHIDALTDAIKNNLSYICIIEGSVLSDDIFKVFERNDITFNKTSILILMPENKSLQHHDKLQNFDKNKLTKFAYCIQQKVFDIYLTQLIKCKNIIESFQYVHETYPDIYIFIYPTLLSLITKNNPLRVTGAMLPDQNNSAIVQYTNSQELINIKNIKPTYNYTLITKPDIQNTKGLTRVKLYPTSKQIIPPITAVTYHPKILEYINQTKQMTKKEIEPLRAYQVPIMQSVFSGIYLNNNEISSILSFINHGHTYHLYTYKNVMNVPVGCVIKSAIDILTYKSKNPNAFKFKLLHIKGNYWVNLNVICSSKFNSKEPYMFLHDYSDAMIKCPANSKFALDCYNSIINNTYNFKKCIESHGLNKFVQRDLKKQTSLTSKIINVTDIWMSKGGISLLEDNKPWYKDNKNIQSKYDQFNLEHDYGKYNNVGVLFYWMPYNSSLINEMEELFTQNLMSYINTSKFSVTKHHGTANQQRIENFIKNDIYIYIMTRLMEFKFIDTLHIIFGMTHTDKYVYNNEPLFSDGNYYKHDNNIHLWKLNDIKSIFSFANAKIYLYKGYGNYEHLYSYLALISPNSIFLRYLATSFPLIESNNKIIVDDNWIHNEYANNKKCKLLNRTNDYYSKHYTNYDIILMDTNSKVLHYKKLFPNTKLFIKFYKYSLMQNLNNERIYDFIFCASDAHPSKNWDIFYGFLNYCEINNKKLKVLIATPVVSNKTLDNYSNFKNVKTIIKRNLIVTEMIEAYNSCKCILITFGRDATPRAMSEAAKCGCFNVVLDILSDGQDMIINNPKLGKIINVPDKQKSYETSYKSVRCDLTRIQYDEMYNLLTANYDHKLISDEFNKDYDEKLVTKNIYDNLCNVSNNKCKLVVTLATENYSNNVNYLLSSIKNTNPNVMVIVYYIGWKSMLLLQFKTCYPNYYFREIKLENYVKGDIIKLKVKLQLDIYLEYTFGYIWIDADSIVLTKLDKLFALIPNYTLSCYYRPNEHYYMNFAVGVIIFGKSNDINKQKINLEFIKKYYDNSLITTGYNSWFYDQTSLYETYNEFKDKINLYELKENEHSINDTIDTIIYSRRTDNKHKLIDILKMKKIVLSNINFSGIKLVYA